jgi:hypothetical protein
MCLRFAFALARIEAPTMKTRSATTNITSTNAGVAGTVIAVVPIRENDQVW